MKLFCLLVFSFANLCSNALLQTRINPVPAWGEHDPEMVAPGTSMQFIAEVENVGDRPSQSANLFLRFTFPDELKGISSSELYRSETQALPSIKPGEKIVIKFLKQHVWPSPFDFIRNDWSIRRYEAVIVSGDQEFLSGTSTITFSAHYYDGPAAEIPVDIEKGCQAPALKPRVLPKPAQIPCNK